MTGSTARDTALIAAGPRISDKTVLLRRPDIAVAASRRQRGGDAPRHELGAGARRRRSPPLAGPAGAAVNAARLNALLAALSDLTCEKFIPDRGKESFGRPVVSITLKGGQEHSLSIFAPAGADAGGHPAVSSASDSPFVLSEDQAKTIMQDPGELLEPGGKQEEKQ
jgi:hypothetical protein